MMKILQILAIFLVMAFTSQCSQEEVQNTPNDSSLNNEITNSNEIKDALGEAIAGDHRTDKYKARDQYRNPLETLSFFELEKDMTVLEIYPYGGWYTEIIAPVLKESGQYYGAMPDPSSSERRKTAFDKFKNKLSDNESLYGNAQAVPILDNTKISLDDNSVDMVLTFRNLHNMMAYGTAEKMLEDWLRVTKSGGSMGIVEHRGDSSIEQDPKAVSGYVNEDYTIKLAEAAGWEFISSSDINNNPKDDKNYEDRVWRLPPTLTYFAREGRPKVEGDDLKKNLEIGESDRYTLLFKKP